MPRISLSSDFVWEGIWKLDRMNCQYMKIQNSRYSNFVSQKYLTYSLSNWLYLFPSVVFSAYVVRFTSYAHYSKQVSLFYNSGRYVMWVLFYNSGRYFMWVLFYNSGRYFMWVLFFNSGRYFMWVLFYKLERQVRQYLFPHLSQSQNLLAKT